MILLTSRRRVSTPTGALALIAAMAPSARMYQLQAQDTAAHAARDMTDTMRRTQQQHVLIRMAAQAVQIAERTLLVVMWWHLVLAMSVSVSRATAVTSRQTSRLHVLIRMAAQAVQIAERTLLVVMWWHLVLAMSVSVSRATQE